MTSPCIDFLQRCCRKNIKATLHWPVERQRFTPFPLRCSFWVVPLAIFEPQKGPLFCFVTHDSSCFLLVSNFIALFLRFKRGACCPCTNQNLAAAGRAASNEQGRLRIGGWCSGERAYYHWRCWQCERITGTDWSCQWKRGGKVISTFDFWLPLVSLSSFAPSSFCIKRNRWLVNYDYRKILWILLFCFFSFAFPDPLLTVQHFTLLFAVDTKIDKWEETAYFVPLCAMIFYYKAETSVPRLRELSKTTLNNLLSPIEDIGLKKLSCSLPSYQAWLE